MKVLNLSAASMCEIAVKNGLGRTDFKVTARLLKRGLLDNDCSGLTITSAHAVFVEGLPLIHRDPFDRILIAQATVEGITLLTADATEAKYPGSIEFV